MKRLMTSLGAICVTLLVFAIYSAAVTFNNWPWTVRSDATDQRIAGIVAGSDKATVLDQAIAGKQAGVIRGMMPVGQTPGTAEARITGSDISPRDLDRFAEYDQWVVGLAEPDRYLDLKFNGDRLAKVTLREYRGPHE